MIEDKVLESNVPVLRTPLVDIEIVDEEEHNISFDIVESWNTDHSVYINNDENNIIEATDYDEKQIRIRTASLEFGKRYYVKTSVPIESVASDEHLFTYGLTIGDKTFAISFPDPNDSYKDCPECFDEDWWKMMWYDFEREYNRGTKPASFYLIDREKEFIYIPTAWIWNIHDHMTDYESAAEVFTWIV